MAGSRPIIHSKALLTYLKSEGIIPRNTIQVKLRFGISSTELVITTVLESAGAQFGISSTEFVVTAPLESPRAQFETKRFWGPGLESDQWIEAIGLPPNASEVEISASIYPTPRPVSIVVKCWGTSRLLDVELPDVLRQCRGENS